MVSWVSKHSCLSQEVRGHLSHMLVVVMFLERPLHPKEKVLEQALQWCKMADPSSAYLVVKRVPKGEGITLLTCRWTQLCDNKPLMLH